MNALLNYDLEELSTGAELDVPEVREVLTKFIKQNVLKFTMYQFVSMLGVTPAFIQSVLSVDQLRRMGKKPAATVIILRDYNKFDEDKEKYG